MHGQNFRLFLYSSMAILGLTLVWGFHQIPKQRDLAANTLRSSLEQELIVLNGATKSATNTLRFRLLDVLKAEGNDRPTRAFQDSPFAAAALLEWNESQWKILWQSVKNKSDTEAFAAFRDWMKEWPLAELQPGEAHFSKVIDVGGQPHFALITPVRRPNAVPMIGVGIFPAAQFGVSFSSERTREMKVFDDKGMALALTRPAYLGSSLKREPLAKQIFESDEVSARKEWTADNGTAMIGAASRVADTNLVTAIESPASFGGRWRWQSWLYLILCGAGAVGLNWLLFQSLMRPLLEQISRADVQIENLRRSMHENPPKLGVTISPTLPAASAYAIDPELDEEFGFADDVPAAPAPAPKPSLNKVVQAALRTLEPRARELGVSVKTEGLDGLDAPMDALQLQTAIEEVLKNSLEAMETSSARILTVSASKQNDKVVLRVDDTGVGITAENLEKVFDPFYSTKDSEGVSRGLGLNVVRRVLEEIHGKVRITSQPGARTTVELSWPLEEMALESTLQVPTRAVEKPAPQPAPQMVTSAAAKAKASLLELDEDDDFESLIMGAPLVRTKAEPVTKNYPDVAIRRPVVRNLD